MKNLITELLVKLAQKEDESKTLMIQVEALEIVVKVLLRQRRDSEPPALYNDVNAALNAGCPHYLARDKEGEYLRQYIKKLVLQPRS